MYDDRNYRRRYRNRFRNPLGGLAAGIVIIGLALAFYFSSNFGGHLFLPILFAGLALMTLIYALTLSRRSFPMIHGFIWLLTLGACFLIGFWPWVLAGLGLSLI